MVGRVNGDEAADPVIRVAARGEGVTAGGRHEPLCAPGDVVLPSGEIRRGPHHQAAPCRHFPICGGCRLQHLDDISFAGFLTDRIGSALASQMIATTIRAPTLSPARTRRRATLHAERGNGRVVLGFSEAAGQRLVDLRECWVLSPPLFALVAPLRKLLERLGMPRRRIDIDLTEADQGIDIVISGIDPAGLAAADAISDFCTRSRVARLSVDAGLGAETRWAPEPVTITLGGIPVALPHGAFLQATRHGEAALVDAVREAVGGARRIADLFAGVGTFALAMSGRIYAAEAARDAAAALAAVGSLGGRSIAVEHRDLYWRPLTAVECSRFDAIIVDPPRAGAREQAQQLAAASTPIIASVSCNPASFARDARILIDGGFRLDWVQPVGQFRWSTQVELVGCFSR